MTPAGDTNQTVLIAVVCVVGAILLITIISFLVFYGLMLYRQRRLVLQDCLFSQPVMMSVFLKTPIYTHVYFWLFDMYIDVGQEGLILGLRSQVGLQAKMLVS